MSDKWSDLRAAALTIIGSLLILGSALALSAGDGNKVDMLFVIPIVYGAFLWFVGYRAVNRQED